METRTIASVLGVVAAVFSAAGCSLREADHAAGRNATNPTSPSTTSAPVAAPSRPTPDQVRNFLSRPITETAAVGPGPSIAVPLGGSGSTSLSPVQGSPDAPVEVVVADVRVEPSAAPSPTNAPRSSRVMRAHVRVTNRWTGPVMVERAVVLASVEGVGSLGASTERATFPAENPLSPGQSVEGDVTWALPDATNAPRDVVITYGVASQPLLRANVPVQPSNATP